MIFSKPPAGIVTYLCKNRYFLYILLTLSLIIPVSTHSYYFGKNKVQYHKVEWQELNTEHLTIYYYDKEKELAEMTAVMGEKTIEELETTMKHTLTRPVPLIIYSTPHIFQETNIIPFIIPESVGGVTEFFKGRVLVPYNGSLSDFRDTLHHELVHFFQLNKMHYEMRRYRQYDYPTPPLWFMEGTAEYLSTEWGSKDDMVMADAVIHGHFTPLESISYIYGSYLLYKEGQDLIRFIAERYGADKIPLLMENMKEEKNWRDNVEYTLGISYNQLSKIWERDVKSRYFPLIDTHQDPEIDYNHLTGNNGLSLSPQIYEQGGDSYLVFQSNERGYSNIYKGKLDFNHTGELYLTEKECIIKGERTEKFESLHLFSSRMDIHNHKLVFISKSGGDDALNIYDLRRDETVFSVKFPELPGLSSPKFDQTGERITFSGMNFSGREDIYLYYTKSGELTQLTDDWHSDTDPTFTTDGEYVIFSSDRSTDWSSSSYDLFKLNINSGIITPLTDDEHTDLTPEVIDDNTLLFSSDREGFFNIFSLNISTGETEQLTNSFTGSFEPVYSNSLNSLLFAGFCNQSYKIYSITPIDIDFYEVADTPSLDFEYEKTLSFEYGDEDINWTRKNYDIDFSLDFAQAQVGYAPGYATQAGFILYFTDMLNNHNIQLGLSNTAENIDEFLSHFNIVTTYFNTGHRLNYGFGGFHLNDDYYDEEGILMYSEETYGGSTLFLYPFSRFYRLEFGASLFGSRRKYLGEKEFENGFMVSNYISLVKDTTLWGNTGPIDGARYNITVSQTSDLGNKKFRYFLFIGDLRKYFRLSDDLTYAVRTIFRSATGPDALPLNMGGSLSMRGYKFHDFSGTKFFMVNQELRFPIVKSFFLTLPFGNVRLGGLKGALFFDVGEAWTEKLGGLRGDFGFGLRWGFGGFLVLRLDIAKKTNFHSISDDTAVRFFIGWDY